MKTGQVALAFTGGYIIGRNHKMRWALTLAGVAAGRRLASGRGPVDTKALKSTELGRLAQDFRGQLVSAGRSAAVSAASHRIDALSDRLERGSATLRSRPDALGAKEGAKEKGATEEREEREEREDKEEPEPGTRAGTRAGAKTRSDKRSGDSKPKKSADRPARAKKKPDTGGSRRRSQG